MSLPFPIDDDFKYELCIESTENGYQISFKNSFIDVWDYDISEYFDFGIDGFHLYRKKLRKLGGYIIGDNGHTTFFKRKQDLQPILEWLESLQIAKKLAGEL